jgi:hypothetical protein
LRSFNQNSKSNKKLLNQNYYELLLNILLQMSVN